MAGSQIATGSAPGTAEKSDQLCAKKLEQTDCLYKDGNLKPDNNVAENAILPFVLGRKNWLFAGSPNGAEASETCFTLIEAAVNANGIEPYDYLRYLFEQLPLTTNKQGYLKLLPQNVDRDKITRSQQ